MKTKTYDFIVMIGRFQPFTIAHNRNLLQALDLADQVIIILGSDDAPRTIENPFSTTERMEYITACIPEEFRSRVKFNGIPDTLYQNAKWVENVDAAVRSIIRDYFPENVNNAKIVTLAHDKDASTFYLKMLPWEVIDAGAFVKEKNGGVPISATKVRELLFTNYLAYTESILPPAMYDWLQNFVTTQTFADLKEQYELELTYLPDAHDNMIKGKWATNFYTADAVVIQTGHILLGFRDSGIGKGLWRLPGGHVNPNETSFEGAIREVYEETNLKIPEKVLIGSYKGEKLFDHPKRSLRGRVTSKSCRTATVSHCFKLADGEALPRVKHGDDLDDVWWFTFNEVRQMRSLIIEDHLSIIDYWLARIEQ